MLRRFLLLCILSLAGRQVSFGAVDTFSVFFRSNDNGLTPEVKQQIDAAIYNGSISDWMGIMLIGYADEVGKNHPNMRLSKARAESVKSYLVQSGFRAESITLVTGMGKLGAHSVSGGAGFPRDRRVDIVRTAKPAIPVAEPVVVVPPAMPVDISKVPAGENFRLDKIYFEPGSRAFKPESAEALEALYKTLAEHPAVRIRIYGHVCCTYGEEDGLDEQSNRYELSITRAQAVKDYLVNKGIDASRLEAIGMARHKPIYPAEHTSEEMQANRRVEIRVL